MVDVTASTCWMIDWISLSSCMDASSALLHRMLVHHTRVFMSLSACESIGIVMCLWQKLMV